MFEKVIDDGYEYYTLGTAGYIVFGIIAVLAVLAVCFLFRNKGEKKTSGSAKQLAFSAVALALGYALSLVHIFSLPWGGAVTLFSMLFITLAGYLYGLKAGLTVAFAFSILHFLVGGATFILSPLQVCLDYIFAYTALGLSGLFKNRKNGLVIGYIVAILARGAFHTLAGYMYWMDYMPEDFPQALAFLYPFIYNYSFILIEGIATVLVLSIPAVKKGIEQVKRMATE